MMNDYIMFRLLMDEAEKSKQKHLQHRASLIPPAAILAQHRASITSTMDVPAAEPFCSPLVPHVPIRERLARRGTSVDVADEIPGSSSYLNSFYGPPRRRRMSLLQTLRQQNRQLNDSGFDVNRQRTESESTNRDTCSPPAKTSPPQSPSKKALASLKAKIFGKKDKRQNAQAIGIEDGNGRSRKSPSTTNDSGRGSQGHLEERNPFATNEIDAQRRQSHERKKVLRLRTSSCPCLPGLCDLPHKNGEDSDGDVDGIGDDEEIFPERMLRNSSPVSAADCLLERRLMRRAVEVERRRLLESVSLSHSSTSHHNQSHRPRATIAIPESCSESLCESPPRSLHLNRHQSLSSPTDSAHHSDCTEKKHYTRSSSNGSSHPFGVTVDLHCPQMEDILSVTSMAVTEDLCDYDDSSTLLLDHYLPLSRSELDHNCGDSLSNSLSNLSLLPKDLQRDKSEKSLRSSISPDSREDGSSSVSCPAQTDLSLINISDQLGAYLNRLNSDEPPSPEGMNFIAKHFFEYQSFINLPHKAVQLHKPQASQAGTDPSVGWAPKNMNKAGKNQPAPASRASRTHRDPRPNGTKHGRAAKHEHREWGDRHGELKEEKVAPHKDAWTKFLANEDPAGRTVFECDFEDTVLQVEEEALPDRLARTSNEQDDLEFQMAYNANKSSNQVRELLIILTYAPLVQFVTVTVKKAKTLPYNNSPFARIMLFDGRRLIEQKQTTVDPSVGVNSSVDSARPSSSSVSSSLSSTSGGDASFSESFLFHVPPHKLDRAHVVIEVFDHSSSSGALSVGHCVIGRLGGGTGQSHWLQMIRKNSLPVCMWHRIQKGVE
ncbi:unnamed protein product, partial [Mesorhabditis belari]|uniref:C2 domain-containing protein n=1 Tax=Mesorhabditis belari TaxID=2138241 RepID=A0AAF3EZ98_9BILA